MGNTFKTALLSVALFAGSVSVAYADKGTIDFEGTIQAGSCTVAPGDATVTVELGVMNQSVLEKGHSEFKEFKIKLIDCVADDVTVTFGGDESSDIADALAIDGIEKAGIIMTDAKDVAIPLNEESSVINVQNGANELNFKAAVKGMQGVGYGDFSAAATFTLGYK